MLFVLENMNGTGGVASYGVGTLSVGPCWTGSLAVTPPSSFCQRRGSLSPQAETPPWSGALHAGSCGIHSCTPWGLSGDSLFGVDVLMGEEGKVVFSVENILFIILVPC